MSCAECGSACTGRLCAPCLQQVANEKRARAGSFDSESFVCPECGGDTSGPGVTCFRCRGGGR